MPGMLSTDSVILLPFITGNGRKQGWEFRKLVNMMCPRCCFWAHALAWLLRRLLPGSGEAHLCGLAKICM